MNLSISDAFRGMFSGNNFGINGHGEKLWGKRQFEPRSYGIQM